MTPDPFTQKFNTLKDYEDFLNDPEYQYVRKEAAILRSTLLRLLDAIDQRAKGLPEKILQRANTSLVDNPLTSEQQSILSAALHANLSGSETITHKDIKSITTLCKSIANVLKLEKDLTEGATLTIRADMEDLLFVIRNGVFPPLPQSMRKIVIESIAGVVRERFGETQLALSPHDPDPTTTDEHIEEGVLEFAEDPVPDLPDLSDLGLVSTL